jgi:glycosyltransferase involved in cell wall biosynthesis
MNFLIVSSFNNDLNSGAAGSLIAIGEQLQVLGHSIDYIWEIPISKRIIKSHNYYRFIELPFRQYKQTKAALGENKYDVVIISQPHAWYTYKKLKKKYPNVIFINRTHGWEKRIGLNTKHMISKSSNLKSKISQRLVFLLTKHCSYFTVKYADIVITACSDDAKFIQADYPKFKEKIISISYGIDKNYQGIELKQKIENDKIKFLFTGQYLKRKGVEDLQEIFYSLKDLKDEFELCFIVNNSAIGQVRKDFDFLDNSLIVNGWMMRNELIEKYKTSDIFLMTSYGEGFGKTTIEAMACGLCVIGYKEGALTDIGIHKENSLLNEVGDKNGLLENFKFALNNPTIIRTIGKKAYYDIQQYTWTKCAKETINIINQYIKLKNI